MFTLHLQQPSSFLFSPLGPVNLFRSPSPRTDPTTKCSTETSRRDPTCNASQSLCGDSKQICSLGGPPRLLLLILHGWPIKPTLIRDRVPFTFDWGYIPRVKGARLGNSQRVMLIAQGFPPNRDHLWGWKMPIRQLLGGLLMGEDPTLQDAAMGRAEGREREDCGPPAAEGLSCLCCSGRGRTLQKPHAILG